ncbi:uncharacterized protein LAESUDRAFT_717778 [Laetiporus sulphureus 93-53]|uniref:Uncharacterized protein n=1 Tax=Laetiporus sulphureus 93-53 TaxID=1314785 RepID=A0A165BFZ0_9APHY|nr:uncharacterized protein LAESUDRAFT_717778 [Laetiporus sulphureus 93-53]KZT00976.1 hypothetical protein LAESUDRAFT_717778 [Laetiporus sulphureus 93-53]
MSTTRTVSSLSPQWNRIQQDAKLDVQTALPDDDSKQEAANVIDKALSQEDDFKDIKRLADTIRDIRAGFMEVAGDLARRNVIRSDQKLSQLSDEWQKYIQRFDEIVQNSLTQATDAVVILKNLCAVFNIVNEGDGEELRQELEDLIETVKEKETKALSFNTDFSVIADKVHIFSERLDAALGHTEERTANVLERERAHLDELRNKLSALNDRLHALAIEVVTAVAGGVGAAVTAIFTLSPSVLISAVGSILWAVPNCVSIYEVRNEREALLKDIALSEQQIKELDGRHHLLDTVENVSVKIKIIANIWQTIRLDLHDIHETLGPSVRKGARLNKFFMGKLKNAQKVYNRLLGLLRTLIRELHSGLVSVAVTAFIYHLYALLLFGIVWDRANER